MDITPKNIDVYGTLKSNGYESVIEAYVYPDRNNDGVRKKFEFISSITKSRYGDAIYGSFREKQRGYDDKDLINIELKLEYDDIESMVKAQKNITGVIKNEFKKQLAAKLNENPSKLITETDDLQNIDAIDALIAEIQKKLDSRDYRVSVLSDFVKPVQYIHVSLPELNVYLTPLKTSVEGHFYEKDYKDFKAPYVLVHNNRFKKNKVIIDDIALSHELQHYLDWRRGTKFNKINILKPEGGIDPEYYNDVNEMQAFIIQVLREYIKVVKLKNLPEDYQSFYKMFFRKTEARDFYKHLSETNRNAFNSRLQEFHKKLLERKHQVKNVVREELQNFWEQQQQIHDIRGLAELMQRMGYDKEGIEILQNMLLDAYRESGDQGVIDMYKGMTGTEIHAISKGRYTFEPLTGGGEPMLEAIEQRTPQEIADNLIPSEYWERMEKNNPDKFRDEPPVLANVDVGLADQAFRRDADFYIGRDDKGIGSRKERVLQNIENSELKYAPDVSIRMNNGLPVLSFGDGRHRFAVLRDLGVKTINLTFSISSKPYIHLLQR